MTSVQHPSLVRLSIDVIVRNPYKNAGFETLRQSEHGHVLNAVRLHADVFAFSLATVAAENSALRAVQNSLVS